MSPTQASLEGRFWASWRVENETNEMRKFLPRALQATSSQETLEPH